MCIEATPPILSIYSYRLSHKGTLIRIPCRAPSLSEWAGREIRNDGKFGKDGEKSATSLSCAPKKQATVRKFCNNLSPVSYLNTTTRAAHGTQGEHCRYFLDVGAVSTVSTRQCDVGNVPCMTDMIDIVRTEPKVYSSFKTIYY
jgi:hypothetical protein